NQSLPFNPDPRPTNEILGHLPPRPRETRNLSLESLFASLKGKVIALDGVTGEGKSSQVEALRKISERHGFAARTLPEFSDSEIGQKITEIVVRQRYFSLRPGGDCTVADTFAVFADLAYRSEVEKPFLPEAVTFADRGILSNAAYQTVRLARQPGWNTERAIEFVTSLVETLSQSIQPPDVHLWLRIDPAERTHRIELREGQGVSVEEQADFQRIESVMEYFSQILPVVQVDVSRLSPEETSERILSVLSRHWQ
ncbi:MAG: hypothetical protein KDD64_13910, partial [Bdellovibrionales bacterium]|nr:hypothetical protein [Bdellovibrionales bacterium]